MQFVDRRAIGPVALGVPSSGGDRTPNEFRTIIREELEPVEERLDTLKGKVDTIHRDVLSLRAELQGVIDAQFPVVREGVA